MGVSQPSEVATGLSCPLRNSSFSHGKCHNFRAAGCSYLNFLADGRGSFQCGRGEEKSGEEIIQKEG